MHDSGYQTILKSLYWGIAGYNPAMSKHYKSILAFSISDDAKFRLQVINHHQIYGLESTKGAFKISKATIYRWRKEFKQSRGQLQSLIPKSRAPKRKRRMETDLRILEFIKNIRGLHPRIGKDKIKHLFIYPRCPKINGFIERANRSLREEFLNQNQELVLSDHTSL